MPPDHSYQKLPRPFPLTAMQQGMLFNALFAPQSGVDLEQCILHLPEPIDGNLLEQAWRVVVRHHPILRTCFRWEGLDEPVQGEVAEASVQLRQIDLAGRDPAAQEEEIRAYCRHDRSAGFAYDMAPLTRLTLFRLGSEEFRLLWSFPHAILDGRSIPLIYQDVFAAYEALRQGLPAPSMRPPEYRSYIAWLRRQDLGACETFWREHLRGFTHPTPLVGERLPQQRQASTPSIEHAVAEIALAPALVQRLHELAASVGGSLHTCLQAAWAMTLARTSGETDVVFGSTRACRHAPVPDIEHMPGLFINTLPLRLRIDPQRSVRDFLREVKSAQVALRPYEHSPLVRIQEWSQLPRGTRLFDSILVYEHTTIESTLRALGGRWTRRSLEMLEKTSFPLTLTAWGAPTPLIRAMYDETRFHPGVVEQLLGHLAAILAQFAEDADRPLAAIDHAGAELAVTARESWNAPAQEPDPALCLHHLVERQAARLPDRPAVICGDERLSYGELERRACAIALRLHHAGVGCESPVVVLLERSLDLACAVLGVLKTGGCYVPLDPGYPSERVHNILTQTRAAAVITTPAIAERFQLSSQPGLLALSPGWHASAVEETAPVPCGATARTLAYVIFTSGSTGRPKGVMIEHGGAVNTILDLNDRFGVGEDDRLLGLSSYTFDLSVYDLFGMWAAGGTVVLPPPGATRDPEQWQQLIDRHRVTIWNSVPALLEMAVEAAQAHQATAPTIRLAMLSGDWIPTHLPERARGYLPRAELYSLGGATEASIWSIIHRIGHVDPEWPSIPYGRPMRNQKMFVLDERLEPCAPWITGEICIGGVGLARGYWNDADKTAAAFIQHPRWQERLYRTGDLGRWHPDGVIEFLGRKDQQVKIRGFRIELGEIEAVASQLHEIKEVVVAARDAGGGNRMLVLYFVPHVGAEITSEQLRAHLQRHLPEYMVPSAYLALEAMPLSANGKVDRAALPAPKRTARTTTRRPERHEEQLIALWQEILGRDGIDVDDHFFELGGNSLLALRLVDRLEKRHGITIALAAVFEHPTLARLAAHIQSQAKPASILIPLQPAGDRRPFFFISGFLDIGRHVGNDQPFYGLDCPAEAKAASPETSFEELAERCLAEMRRVQARGPYLLGGHCFGAVVAFVIANLLQARGEKVRLLTLMDPPAPRVIAREGARLARVWFHLRNLLLRNPLAQVRYVADRLRNLRGRRQAGMGDATVEELYRNFQPRMFHGRAVMVFAKDTYLRYRPAHDPRLGWQDWCSAGLEIIESPGDHVTFCREPHVRTLARLLRARLDDAQRYSAPTPAPATTPTPAQEQEPERGSRALLPPGFADQALPG